MTTCLKKDCCKTLDGFHRILFCIGTYSAPFTSHDKLADRPTAKTTDHGDVCTTTQDDGRDELGLRLDCTTDMLAIDTDYEFRVKRTV